MVEFKTVNIKGSVARFKAEDTYSLRQAGKHALYEGGAGGDSVIIDCYHRSFDDWKKICRLFNLNSEDKELRHGVIIVE